jgi:hypothetical protein
LDLPVLVGVVAGDGNHTRIAMVDGDDIFFLSKDEIGKNLD